MGIPSYFKYIISNYNIIFKKKNKIRNIHNLYIDSNSIIYDSLRELDLNKYIHNDAFEDDLNKLILNKIVEYIKCVAPEKRVFVAVDGVVPYAKIEQQRQRRYKSSLLKENERLYRKIFNDELKEKCSNYNTYVLNDKHNEKFTWDQTSITPGTKFMENLDAYLKSELEIISDKSNLEIKYSGSNETGEGEHKIFKYMRDIQHNEDITCVYGLDADLIMLSLNHLHMNKEIYLIREKPSFSNELDEIYEDNELMFMSMSNLSKNIIDCMTNKKGKIERTNKLHDYIFISFLLGNDFMPHFSALNIRIDGIDILFNYYKKCFDNYTTIIEDGKIVWKRLKKFVKLLSENENALIITNSESLIKEGEHRNKKYINSGINNKTIYSINNKINGDSTFEEKVSYIKKEENAYIEQQLYNYNLTPSKERTKEKFIDPKRNEWNGRYYKSLFYINMDEQRIKNICNNYLEGLEWCFEYYLYGCKDYRWKYNYFYPPLLKDLYRYIPDFNTTFINNPTNKEDYDKHITPKALLCYVVPEKSLTLLPEKIRTSVLEKYYYNYVDNHDFSYAYCKYLWEGHIEFPYVNLDELINFVVKQE